MPFTPRNPLPQHLSSPARPSRRGLLVGAAALSLAGTALSACNPRATSAKKETGGPLRFTWWGNAERIEATNQVIDLFEASRPGVTVNGEPGDLDSYWDRLNTSIAAGDEPDVITMGGAYPSEYAARELLLDLSTMGEQIDLSVFDPAALATGQVDGVQVALPTGINAPAMIVNRTVLDAAGVDLPDPTTWTWEDYTAAAIAVSESGTGAVGSGTVLTHDSLDLWARQHGQNLYTQDGRLGLDVSTVESFFAFALELVTSGAAPTADILVEQTGVGAEQSLLGTGKAAFMLTWSSSFTALSGVAGDGLEIVQIPGESIEPGGWLQPSQSYTVSARTTAPEDAAALVSFLLTDPEAGKIIGTDRGVPAVASQREAILADLPDTAKAEVEYIDSLSAAELKPTWIGPAGSTAIEEITPRMQTEVLFARLTAAKAAEQWMAEAEAAIAK